MQQMIKYFLHFLQIGVIMSSTQIRVRNELLDQLEETKWQIKYNLRIEIQNTDVINALIMKHLDKVTEEDVLEYRKKYLGKDDDVITPPKTQ